jgi:acyl-CoA reductase-like NAD-dependent aldehyde dehydrogenase
MTAAETAVPAPGVPEPVVVVTRWAAANGGAPLVVDDPATGRPIAAVTQADADAVDRAVQAAAAAQRTWAERPPRERARVLRRIAQVVRDHADEIARIESQEMGKPVGQARGTDVEACITLFEYFAGLVEAMPSAIRDEGFALDLTMLEPYGVVAGVVPFNWPPLHVGGKAAPALAVGNAVVLKPPETAPLAILRIIEMAQSVLPDDVLHAVVGGPDVGAALTAHPLVSMITFTGSTATGSVVAHAAADRLVPTLLELGGKNPLIVFDDADLEAAVVGSLEGGFVNSGEACTASSRIVVQRGVHDEVVARLAGAVPRLRVGRGTDPATHVGPMITRRHQQRVEEYLRVAVAEGAVIAAQADVPSDPDLRDGFFVRPTLITGVTPTMRVAQEEIFGPVICVIPFDTEDEAVAIANGTEFGLIAGLYSRDSERTMRVARRLDAGIVFINNYNRSFIGTPFGGTRRSGYGRVHSPDTLRTFARTKSLRVPSGLAPVPRWGAVAELLDPAEGGS